ncbi:hypothetical protein [Melittangium boletus]|uniref:Uncharacterized protein n=1 Tax=Melittangium boletus DSM 14713 TaxID=1294270 RepID=A0A250I8R0_9BACT|nr:hypothetical protein [Melittangium boletus]ATB27542.1 hypothetical protein MEBOL_000985 [Melittangium boletus DSM 14713]
MESPPLKACPRCGEPRILAPECPRCGVLYAKAQPRAARPAPEALAAEAVPLEFDPSVFRRPEDALARQRDIEESRGEWRLRLFALPGVFAVIWWLDSVRLLRFMFDILGMFLHELGHAMTAWFCGIAAMPSLWVTHISGERSPFFLGMMTFGLTGLVFRGVLTRSPRVRNVGLVGLTLQFIGTVLVTSAKVWPLISFGGDAGSLVLGALLMTSLYTPRESFPRRGYAYWGLMVIGAASFVSTFREWWAARTDFERIPFGDIEGVGLSDSSTLVDKHGWSELDLIHRYNGLGLACLAALALVYVLGLWRIRATRDALERPRGA